MPSRRSWAKRQRKDKGEIYSSKSKVHSRACLARPPLRLRHPPPPPPGAIPTIHPTPVSHRKVRAAFVTLPSPNRALTGIVAAGSRLVTAGALLSHRQARFKQRLFKNPQGNNGSEEILTRERATLTTRLKAAAALWLGESVENRGGAPADSSPAKSSSRGERVLFRPRGSGGAGTQSRPTARVWAAERWEHPVSRRHRSGEPAAATTPARIGRTSARRSTPYTRHSTLLTNDRKMATGTCFLWTPRPPPKGGE